MGKENFVIYLVIKILLTQENAVDFEPMGWRGATTYIVENPYLILQAIYTVLHPWIQPTVKHIALEYMFIFFNPCLNEPNSSNYIVQGSVVL